MFTLAVRTKILKGHINLDPGRIRFFLGNVNTRTIGLPAKKSLQLRNSVKQPQGDIFM